MAQASAALEHELTSPPTDGISNVVFANNADLLLVSSWDKGVRLYDVKKNQLRQRYEHKAPVLDCAFSSDDNKCFSGGIDKYILINDFKTGKKSVLGSHEKPIKCIEFSSTTGLVISGSWDCSVALWDPRTSKSAGSVSQAGCKIYSMDIVENRIVVATSGRNVFIYDIRNLGTPEQVRESSLMNQTRCIRSFPDGTGYALSSIEGRVAVEYFDPSPQIQKKKYAFKCHRKIINGSQTLYPVNSMAFHPKYGTFATGGCDALINIWDGRNKKRICQYPPYPTSIAALDFNSSGTLLAIASSYTFEEGEKEHPPDAIYIRTINDHEVAQKKRKAPAT